jgi:hypothetical protein
MPVRRWSAGSSITWSCPNEAPPHASPKAQGSLLPKPCPSPPATNRGSAFDHDMQAPRWWTTTSCGSARSWLARKDSNLRSPDPEDSRRFRRSSVRLERGADSDSVNPAGNQVEHAGRSQVNVIRSCNSGIDRIAAGDGWEGEPFPVFPLLRDRRRGAPVSKPLPPDTIEATRAECPDRLVERPEVALARSKDSD